MSTYDLRGISRTWALDAVEVKALQEVSVSFPSGAATAVLGPSGSGKSTLLHVAALIDPPTTGGVYFAEQCISDQSDNARSDFRCKRLGFVHQSYPMVAALTPLENIMLPALYAGGSRGDAKRRARSLLEEVGLIEFAYRDVRTLSGGERQRVAIARALVNQPVVVFTDEPTAALDSATGESVLDLLFSITRNVGATLVLATHDATVAERADHLVYLDGGKVVTP